MAEIAIETDPELTRADGGSGLETGEIKPSGARKYAWRTSVCGGWISAASPSMRSGGLVT